MGIKFIAGLNCCIRASFYLKINGLIPSQLCMILQLINYALTPDYFVK